MNARARLGSLHFLAFLAIAIVVLAAVGLIVYASLAPKTGLVATVIPTDVLALTDSDREANGLPPLAENALLDKAAQEKADDMAAKSYFAHVTPTGQTPLYWLDQVGYKYQNVGENLGLNYSDAQALETGWMNSPEHRANVLRPQFTEAGTAVSSGTYEGFPATFAVEIFATPLPSEQHAAMQAIPLLPLPPTIVASQPAASSSADEAAYQDSLRALIAQLQNEVQMLLGQLHQAQ